MDMLTTTFYYCDTKEFEDDERKQHEMEMEERKQGYGDGDGNDAQSSIRTLCMPKSNSMLF